MKFTWDETKNAMNRQKHGVDFAEPKTGTTRIISARKANRHEQSIYTEEIGD
jgi:uncharacterized DUF497 family protein